MRRSLNESLIAETEELEKNSMRIYLFDRRGNEGGSGNLPEKLR